MESIAYLFQAVLTLHSFFCLFEEISIYNDLTGRIPSELGRLWNLKALYLGKKICLIVTKNTVQILPCF